MATCVPTAVAETLFRHEATENVAPLVIHAEAIKKIPMAWLKNMWWQVLHY